MDNDLDVRLTNSISSFVSAFSPYWRVLTVTVPHGKQAKRFSDVEDGMPTKEMILDHVSAFVEPGQLLVIMGHSSSRNVTILDALADPVGLPVKCLQMLDSVKYLQSITSS